MSPSSKKMKCLALIMISNLAQYLGCEHQNLSHLSFHGNHSQDMSSLPQTLIFMRKEMVFHLTNYKSFYTTTAEETCKQTSGLL
ncbi:hypothetical protein Pint_18850 [Pistacia integerrima]|uniref:Uncharacterized protein n=1 Tax=Pistacia integerrima TaxID=434235 RepID=A0ACC0YXX5_9ROSI|nr:hypothetical protein Pint_18850 [Pistacia integerrima]